MKNITCHFVFLFLFLFLHLNLAQNFYAQTPDNTTEKSTKIGNENKLSYGITYPTNGDTIYIKYYQGSLDSSPEYEY